MRNRERPAKVSRPSLPTNSIPKDATLPEMATELRERIVMLVGRIQLIEKRHDEVQAHRGVSEEDPVKPLIVAARDSALGARDLARAVHRMVRRSR